MKDLWQGRLDSYEPIDLRLWQIIKPFAISESTGGICFIGYNTDDGVQRNQGRLGAALGSNAIRKAMQSFPIIAGLPVYDQGNLTKVDLESAQQEYANKLGQALAQQNLPIGLGGGHDIAYASYLGIRQNFPKEKIGIVNFDAHLDNRPYDIQATSGTSFKQILDRDNNASYIIVGYQEVGNTERLRITAEKLNMQIVAAEETTQEILDKLKLFSEKVDILYITFCMDVFDITEAPGVSAPTAIGLEKRKALELLRFLLGTNKVVCVDFAEVNPKLDIDERTARLAARLAYEVMSYTGK